MIDKKEADPSQCMCVCVYDKKVHRQQFCHIFCDNDVDAVAEKFTYLKIYMFSSFFSYFI